MALAVGFEELAGWFEVELPEAAFDFLVTLGQDVETSDLTLTVTPMLADGGYGQTYTEGCTVTDVGTGELQVSLSWDSPTDVDLHVVEPGGEEIFYGADVSSSGGELDLDSNAACAMDHVNNENVTYEGVDPPSGEYIVRVDYYAACLYDEDTYFVVTVFIHGEATTY